MMPKASTDHSALQRACTQLGDVVIDPSLWPRVMADICRAADAYGAMLLQADIRTTDVPRTESMNEIMDYYFRNKWHLNDTRANLGVPLFLRGETVILDQDFMTPEMLRRNPFYNDCLIRNNVPWFAGIQFSAGAAMWALCLQRTNEQGPFAIADKRVLAAISARLTEAATLSTAIGRIALSSATSALDGVRQPALAVDRDGRVLDANAAAHIMVGDDIFVRNTFLGFRDKEAARQLETFVSRMRLVPDTAELPVESFVVRRKSQRPVIVNVLPVPAAARGPFLGARAILTMTSLEPKRGLNAPTLMKAFGLTRAEAQAALLVAEGLSPEQAARDLDISVATFRAQLKAVFAKTGTHRQNELTALVSRF